MLCLKDFSLHMCGINLLYMRYDFIDFHHLALYIFLLLRDAESTFRGNVRPIENIQDSLIKIQKDERRCVL